MAAAAATMSLQMGRLTLGPRRAGAAQSKALAAVRMGSPKSLSACAARVGQKLEIRAPAQVEAVSVGIVAGKMKTRKAAAKRYKITGGGKVMARRPGKQHLNEKMSRNKKKALSQEKALSRSVVKRNVIGALPYAKIVKSKNPKCMEREVNKRAGKAPQPAEE
mmetsp:Transcript_13459/g.34543  ORF Transcript_13459/g.34543 Transcript_13459/m.34543 type:complete len:163 (-) Transcript_13459:139-627(-)|eukprot:jgi/Tetstr1/438993/TSEL_027485.t1